MMMVTFARIGQCDDHSDFLQALTSIKDQTAKLQEGLQDVNAQVDKLVGWADLLHQNQIAQIQQVAATNGSMRKMTTRRTKP